MSDVRCNGKGERETRQNMSINIFTSRTVDKKKFSGSFTFSLCHVSFLHFHLKSPRAVFENKIIFLVVIIQCNQMEIHVPTLCCSKHNFIFADVKMISL